jgi:hypothetical protein
MVPEVASGSTRDFNLRGVPSDAQRDMQMRHVDVAVISVLHAAALIARTLGLTEVHREIMQPEDTWPTGGDQAS